MQIKTRVFVSSTSAPFHSGLSLRLDGARAHYLGTVLRQPVGALIRIFNPQDGEWSAIITALKKNVCDIKLESILRPGLFQSEITPSGSTLVFALLKRDATDMVIRMGTELGVCAFMPIITERTNTHKINSERLAAIAREAVEQCERLDVPQISAPRSLVDLLAAWPITQPLYVGLERVESSFPVSVNAPWGYLIGPEGGFSEKEVSLLKKYDFTHTFSLGAYILRADTAAAAGLSALTIASIKA